MLYIFDIDGTLADISHRLHFIQSKPPDWKSFYSACDMDKPIPEIISVLRALHAASHGIILLSGRSDECRELTERWLTEENIPYQVLAMRREGDYRPDTIVKSEIFDWLHLDAKKIGGIFEDRKQVVDMWRERGFRVFHVADGEF